MLEDIGGYMAIATQILTDPETGKRIRIHFDEKGKAHVDTCFGLVLFSLPGAVQEDGLRIHAFENTDLTLEELYGNLQPLYQFLENFSPTAEMKQEFINKLREQKNASERSRRL